MRELRPGKLYLYDYELANDACLSYFTLILFFFLVPLCIPLIILASIAKGCIRRRVASAQSVYCRCIFSLSRFLIKHLFNSFYLHFSSQS